MYVHDICVTHVWHTDNQKVLPIPELVLVFLNFMRRMTRPVLCIGGIGEGWFSLSLKSSLTQQKGLHSCADHRHLCERWRAHGL